MTKQILRPQEAELLQKIDAYGDNVPLEKLATVIEGGHVSVIRVAEWLQEKKLIKILDHTDKVIELTPLGKNTGTSGFPERQILKYLLTQSSSLKSVKDIKTYFTKQLTPNGFNAGLGWLRRKGWAKIEKGNLVTSLTDEPERGVDEELLTYLINNPMIMISKIPEDLLPGLQFLTERKGILEIQTRTDRILKLTPKGIRALKQGITVKKIVTELTPDLIKSGQWRTADIQSFDISIPVATQYPGKIHPFYQVVKMIRRIFLDLGFTEIRGPIVESAFWNFDALFQPQDHPAREIQDTFYLESPQAGDLPKKIMVNKVKQTHENGWKTGSKGWGGQWTSQIAKQLVLRTHTTATTIHYLQQNPEPPQRAFCIDRVYRNEKIDYSHLAEFHQMEGVVMDKGVTLRDLKGILTTFYNKMGFKKIQFWPSFFPYTEPSMQSSVYVPALKTWVELCGMGIFRPEVTQPFGIKHPVLAWGGGVERLVMLKLGLTNIRQIFRNNLNWLRSEPACLP